MEGCKGDPDNVEREMYVAMYASVDKDAIMGWGTKFELNPTSPGISHDTFDETGDTPLLKNVAIAQLMKMLVTPTMLEGMN